MKINAKQSIFGGIIAFILATSCCWLPALALLLGGTSSLMAFSAGLESASGGLMLLGGLGILYGIYLRNEQKKESVIILESTLTCPNCQQQETEAMPTDACQYFYECRHCHTILKPKAGDCCVYCSYGTVACPPIQAGEDCCA